MVKCTHEDCSDSDREFQSDSTMRQHHTKVHGEKLPNCECGECGDEFYKRGGQTKYCDDCNDKGMNKGSNHYAYTGKAGFVRRIKAHSTCLREGCNESRPAALCFHHKPEYEKRGNVSRMAISADYGLKGLKKEVKKCEVICQNCHREGYTDTEPKEEDIENHTVDWDEYIKTDRTIDTYNIFRNEESRRFIFRNCEYCGQEFFARLDVYKRGGGKFHSQRCVGKSQREGEEGTKSGLVESLKKEGECSNNDCNESRPHCMDFHHLEGEVKSETITKIVQRGGDMEDLKTELKKCELLCANCHQAEHSTHN